MTLSSYYIGETEVTQALWQAVMDRKPSYFSGKNKPVERVSWNDCLDFIKKLNSITGENFRLPTEAEWEFAARGGNKSRGYKYSGSNYIDNVAWYSDNSDGQAHNVATKAPNELGLYDMSGNVREWCRDSFSDSSQHYSYVYYRGGCWFHGARECRVSHREYETVDYEIYLGLRLALQ